MSDGMERFDIAGGNTAKGFKIGKISLAGKELKDGLLLAPASGGEPVLVSEEYVRALNPKVGGYYVKAAGEVYLSASLFEALFEKVALLNPVMVPGVVYTREGVKPF